MNKWIAGDAWRRSDTEKRDLFGSIFWGVQRTLGIQEHANGEMSRKTRYFSHSSGEKSRKNKILLAFIKNKELLHEAVITGNFYLFQYQSDSSCRRGGWTCRCANIPIAAKPANRRWHSCACLNGKSQPPMVRMRLIALRSTRRTSSSLCPRSATHALSVW